MLVRFCIIIFVILNAYSALAIDQETKESLKCIKHFSKFEEQNFIPQDTLYSIALRESGRSHSVHKIRMPWPWAVNVAGSSYYFTSKREAVNFVRDQVKKGKENIDVGCMQVNLKYHADAFSTIEEAFDPAINISYAAIFLKSKYDAMRSWTQAIAHYHSATFELGSKYKQGVMKIASNMQNYKSLINKLVYKTDYVKPVANYQATGVVALGTKTTKKSAARLRSNIMVPIYPKRYKS